MSNKKACELYIQQEIEAALKAGKQPCDIGKELSKWVEKLFNVSINSKAIESRAAKIKNNGNKAKNKDLELIDDVLSNSKVCNFVRQTKNYDLFLDSDTNRDVKRIERLTISMQLHGWIDAYPLHCKLDKSGKLIIKAGHHRFAVARALGLPIKFVVSEDNFEVWEEAYTTNPWSLPDYLCAHSRSGKADYVALERYFKDSKIPLSQSAALLSGRLGTSSIGDIFEFRKGNFKITNPTHAERIKEFISYCDGLGIPFSRNVRFINAVARILLVDGVDEDRLKSKIKSHITFIQKQPDVSGYIKMIDYVYNRSVKRWQRKELYTPAMLGE